MKQLSSSCLDEPRDRACQLFFSTEKKYAIFHSIDGNFCKENILQNGFSELFACVMFFIVVAYSQLSLYFPDFIFD